MQRVAFGKIIERSESATFKGWIVRYEDRWGHRQFNMLEDGLFVGPVHVGDTVYREVEPCPSCGCLGGSTFHAVNPNGER